MKRFLLVFLVLGIGVGSLTTVDAAGKPARAQRTVTGSYGPFPAPVTGCNSPLGTFACMIVHARPTERLFVAEVKDAHGLPVYVDVYSGHERVGEFCGTTRKPVAFPAGGDLRFHVGLPLWGIQLACPQHSVKSTGTIRVTLSNLP